MIWILSKPKPALHSAKHLHPCFPHHCAAAAKLYTAVYKGGYGREK